ncbi:helix-turn-helix transcriptional regulator [Nitrosospira sp. Nsp13]|uniref:helix-turn-helix transcriptional regulator n=1 Tax=Nitrosospira sp. Nsp13 TaxID=1855332 RepID=UPI0008816124|nr:helix-turn-helix transcriptional regulator [Nitrosospira sp. Nsp13]SCX87756.1 DNA-binding transcriptional regulator, CsgD family [Nitrosospira sp. Nsp13]
MNSGVQRELSGLSEVLNRVYKAAFNPSAWNDTLPIMAEWLQAPMAILFTPTVLPEDGGFYFNHGISEVAIALWRAHSQPLEGGNKITITNSFRGGLIFTGDDILSKGKLAEVTWYKEFVKIGIGEVLINTVYDFDSTTHYPTVLSYFRDANTIRFTAHDKWKASLLLPHVCHAMELATRIRDAEYQLATTLKALDRLQHGVLLIGKNKHVLFGNASAIRILNMDDGLRLQVKDLHLSQGNLVAKSSYAHDLMDKAISEVVNPDVLAADHFSRVVLIPRTSKKAAFTLKFLSLPPELGFSFNKAFDPRAIAFLTDNDVPIQINRILLKNSYGLTNAEIFVTELIMEGKCLEEIGEKCGLSVNTLKTHLNRIYGKTNSANRAMLVKLLVRLSQGT